MSLAIRSNQHAELGILVVRIRFYADNAESLWHTFVVPTNGNEGHGTLVGAAGGSVTLAYAFRPATVGCRLFTGHVCPVKPPARRFRIIVAPTLFGLSDAPISATERGASKYSRFRLLIRRC